MNVDRCLCNYGFIDSAYLKVHVRALEHIAPPSSDGLSSHDQSFVRRLCDTT